MALAGHAAGRPLVRLLPLDPAQRADLQQRHRADARSSTSARSPGCCRAARATPTSRSGTSRRSAAYPVSSPWSPACEAEVALAVDCCVAGHPESCYLRLVSIPCQIPFELPAGYRLQEGRGSSADRGRLDVSPVRLRPGDAVARHGARPTLLKRSRESNSAWSTFPGSTGWTTSGCARRCGTAPRLHARQPLRRTAARVSCIAARIAGLGLDPGRARYNLGVTDIPVCGTNRRSAAPLTSWTRPGMVRTVAAVVERERSAHDHGHFLGHRRYAAHHRPGRNTCLGGRGRSPDGKPRISPFPNRRPAQMWTLRGSWLFDQGLDPAAAPALLGIYEDPIAWLAVPPSRNRCFPM